MEGLTTRVVSLPVAESRYASLRAVTGGFAWLKEPVIGVLGEGAAVPDAKRPRSVLERFDLGRRKTTELISGLDWFEVSGDGEWLVVRDSGELRVVPFTAQGRSGRGRQRPGQPVPGPVHGRSSCPLGARVHRGRPVHAARLLGPGHGWRGLARCPGLLPATAGPRIGTASEFTDLLWEVVGELGTSHAYIRPRATPREAARARWACSARTCPRRRMAAGGSTGYCPASPPTRGRGLRWPRRA